MREKGLARPRKVERPGSGVVLRTAPLLLAKTARMDETPCVFFVLFSFSPLCAYLGTEQGAVACALALAVEWTDCVWVEG